MLYAQNKSFVNFVTEKFSCFAEGGKLRAKVNRRWGQYITHCTVTQCITNTSHTELYWVGLGMAHFYIKHCTATNKAILEDTLTQNTQYHSQMHLTLASALAISSNT